MIDPGSTHSFARPGFLKKIGFKTETLPFFMEVSTPTGDRKVEKTGSVGIVDCRFDFFAN